MKNKVEDLNNHLFAQLERLGDESMPAEKVLAEIERSKAITGVASQIIGLGNLVLKAEEVRRDIAGGSKLPLLG